MHMITIPLHEYRDALTQLGEAKAEIARLRTEMFNAHLEKGKAFADKLSALLSGNKA